jgi:hypothetical protein
LRYITKLCLQRIEDSVIRAAERSQTLALQTCLRCTLQGPLQVASCKQQPGSYRPATARHLSPSLGQVSDTSAPLFQILRDGSWSGLHAFQSSASPPEKHQRRALYRRRDLSGIVIIFSRYAPYCFPKLWAPISSRNSDLRTWPTSQPPWLRIFLNQH